MRDRWAAWLLERRHGGDAEQLEEELRFLARIRDRVLANAGVASGDAVLDVGTGNGLIGFGALEQVGESGKVIFSDVSEELLAECRRLAEELGALARCEFLLAPADDLGALPPASVDVVTTRSVLIYVRDKQRAFEEFHRVLRPGGRLSVFEPINSFWLARTKRTLFGYDVTPVRSIADKLLAFYEGAQPAATDPMLNFDERDLLGFAQEAGFAQIRLEYEVEIAPRPLLTATSWETFTRMSANPLAPTLEEAIDAVLRPEEARRLEEHLRPLVERQEGERSWAWAYLRATK